MQTPLSVLLKDKGYVTHIISAQASGYECALKLNQLRIGALLVMDNDTLQGIISERDFISKLVSRKHDPNKTIVEQMMTKDVVTVLPTMTVQEAMKLVTEKRLRHLPVVEEGKVIGLISIGDLTRWVMLQQENEIAALTGYIHGTTR